MEGGCWLASPVGLKLTCVQFFRVVEIITCVSACNDYYHLSVGDRHV